MTTILLKLVASGASVTCPGQGGSDCSTGLPAVNAGSTELKTALGIFFGIAGVISLLMIIIGALMFITSGGNPQNVQKARETIIYAVIGLAVSISAEAIVAFILGRL